MNYMEGKDVSEAFDYDSRYYAFIDSDSSKYSNHEYKLGLNIFRGPSLYRSDYLDIPDCYISSRFTTIKHVLDTIGQGDLLLTVRIPKDAYVVHLRSRFYCNKFIVESMEKLNVILLSRLLNYGAIIDNAYLKIMIYAVKAKRLDIIKLITMVRPTSASDIFNNAVTVAYRYGDPEFYKQVLDSSIEEELDTIPDEYDDCLDIVRSLRSANK